MDTVVVFETAGCNPERAGILPTIARCGRVDNEVEVGAGIFGCTVRL